jgi:hypothetical protein
MERKAKIFFDENLLTKSLLRDNSFLNKKCTKLNRDTIINFICSCGTEDNKVFRQIVNVSGAFCNDCTIKMKLEKTKKTMNKKYNVDNPGQLTDHIDKMKKGNFQKFGYEFASQSPECKEKVKQTNLKNCGYQYALQSPEIKYRIKQTNLENLGVEYPMQSKKVQIKLRENNLKKYGYEYYFQIPEVIEKLKQIYLRFFGVSNPFQSEIIKNKIRQTNFKNFGVEYPMQSTEIKEKYKKTCYDKYGVDHPAKTKEFQKKIQRSAFSKKEFKMPSGDIRLVQGYEPVALNELILKYKEEDIKTGILNIPSIKYDFEDKNSMYFPDIFIPIEKKIIEVKSDWTFMMQFEKNLAKAKQCKKEGYLFEFWIYDKKFNKKII